VGSRDAIPTAVAEDATCMGLAKVQRCEPNRQDVEC